MTLILVGCSKNIIDTNKTIAYDTDINKSNDKKDNNDKVENTDKTDEVKSESNRPTELISWIGEYEIQPDYSTFNDNAEYSSKYGLVSVKSNNKYGFIDTKGNVVIPVIYDEIGCHSYAYGGFDTYFYEGKTVVKKDEKWACVVDFSDGLASIRLGDKEGFIDKQGNQVIPLEYESTLYFRNDIGVVINDNRYGVIDKDNNIIIPCLYEFVSVVDDKVIAVYDKGQVGLFNINGVELTPLSYRDYGTEFMIFATPLADGVYIMAKDLGDNVYFGIVDNKGIEKTPFMYSSFGKLSEGLAAVAKNGKWGYINNKNQEVIPFKYDYCINFSNGFAFVKVGEKWGIIGKDGKEITEFIYDEPSYYNNDIIKVSVGGKYGYIDKTGKEIIQTIYDSADYYPEHNVVIIEKDGKIGCINLNN